MVDPFRRPRTDPSPLGELARLVGADAEPSGSSEVSVHGVTLDSRDVHAGDLFAALPGERWHGARFARAALAAGAVAVLTDPAGADIVGSVDQPLLVVEDPRASLGAVSAAVYGNPADDLLVLGVTGTNGKTTTTWLIEAGLRAAGHRTGLIGTVETRVADSAWPSARTTPEATQLHALLAVMREEGVTAVAMEVSSHALALGRVDGLVLDVAGFTQLGRDHLDLHGDEETYYQAKAKMFTPRCARQAVVTVDDDGGRRLAQEATVPVLRLSVAEAPEAEARVGQLVRRATGGYDAVLSLPGRGAGSGAVGPPLDLHLSVGLPGSFNVSNAALAAAMLVVAGVEPDAVTAGLAAATAVPGRMEPVDHGQQFVAVVDYAHTPDALAQALTAVRPERGRLIVVFGCGGDRDVAKRGPMGAVAARLADVVVVTDDNPQVGGSGADPGRGPGGGRLGPRRPRPAADGDRAGRPGGGRRVGRGPGFPGGRRPGGGEGARDRPGGGRGRPPVRRPDGARAGPHGGGVPRTRVGGGDRPDW